LEPESSASKYKSIGFDRVYMRRMAKQKIELQELKFEAKINDTPIEESLQVKQSKRGKGKQPVTYPSRPKTRPKNKLRLNSKGMFKPSLKKDNLIIIDEDVNDEVLKKTRKGKKQMS
jgi:hemin uptake protein HemP